MSIVVVADDRSEKELRANEAALAGDIVIVRELSAIPMHPAACIDLLFDGTADRAALLQEKTPSLLIVHSPLLCLDELPAGIVRINAWPGFLARSVMEAACRPEQEQAMTEVAGELNKQVVVTPDIPGFLTARVLASIINEAYLALEESVSTRAEIDIAMKLGTNYPYGPFEWSEKIGLQNIGALLLRLSEENERYAPSSLLLKEASL